MKINKCIILTGSNVKPYSKVREALQELKQLDPSLKYLPETLTSPLGENKSRLYLNQLISLETLLPLEELILSLKNIERKLGKAKNDKTNDFIIIDIDLIYFNATLLKPKEATLPYVQDGLKRFQFLFF